MAGHLLEALQVGPEGPILGPFLLQPGLFFPFFSFVFSPSESDEFFKHNSPGSLNLRLTSPLEEKLEEKSVPDVPIWVWQVVLGGSLSCAIIGWTSYMMPWIGATRTIAWSKQLSASLEVISWCWWVVVAICGSKVSGLFGCIVCMQRMWYSYIVTRWLSSRSNQRNMQNSETWTLPPWTRWRGKSVIWILEEESKCLGRRPTCKTGLKNEKRRGKMRKMRTDEDKRVQVFGEETYLQVRLGSDK